ncbi:MAG: iron-sulfur cluster repair di-iron protein [Acidimicrobiia bacterium]
MSIATSDQTLAEIVNARPQAARVLEAFGLDYCCGGQRQLVDACAEQGLDAEPVVAAISELDPEPAADWAAFDPRELVDHLEAVHHSYLKTELPRLDLLTEKVAGVHGDRHPELHEVRSIFLELRGELEPHLMKEERVLFPMIRELVESTAPPQFHCGSLQNPISVMLREHDRAGELLRALRTASDGYAVPDDGCASYHALYSSLAELEADTHLHIHKENNALFPTVVALEADRSSHV